MAKYTLKGGDHNVVSNLRSEYDDKLATYSDEEVAQAWREFSLSDEYQQHKDNPILFREWAQMSKDGKL